MPEVTPYKPIMPYKLMLSNATDGAGYLGHFRRTQEHLSVALCLAVNLLRHNRLLMVLRTSGISAVPNTYKPIMSYKLMLSNATDGAPYLGHFRRTQHLQAYYVVQVNAKQCY